MATPRTFPTHIDIPREAREGLVKLLNDHLADTTDLYTQAKQAHWNVKGPQFYQLHLLFDLVAGELLEYVDLIAERITTLGGTAYGTARMAAAATRLPEFPLTAVEGREHRESIIERYGLLATTTREAIDRSNAYNDADTADLFTQVSRGLDLRLWFLEAHLQG